MAPTLAAAGDDPLGRIDDFLRGRCQDGAPAPPPAPQEGPSPPRPPPAPAPAGVATLLSPPRRGPGYRDLTIAPGTLGLTLDLAPGRGGVITAVRPSCAFGDVLRVGDVLASVDGRRIARVEDLHAGKERPRVFRVVAGGGGPPGPATAGDGGRARTRAARAARRAGQGGEVDPAAAVAVAATDARRAPDTAGGNGEGAGSGERAAPKAGRRKKGGRHGAAVLRRRRATRKARAAVSVATQTAWDGRDCAPGALPPGAAHVCGPYPAGPEDPAAGAAPAAPPGPGGDRCRLPPALRALPLPAKPYQAGHEYFPLGRRLGVKRALLSAYALHRSAGELEALLAGPAAPPSALARGAVREAARAQAAQRDAILGADVRELAWFEGVLLRLVRFKVDHNHLDVTEATGGESLSNNVKRLRLRRADEHLIAPLKRKPKGRMFFEENVPLLTELGFVWTCPRRLRGPKKDWDEMFQLLVAYKEEHGHCNVPQLYKTPPAGDDAEGAGLGAWVSNNRKAYEYHVTADARELDEKIRDMLESRKLAPRERAPKRKHRHEHLPPDRVARLDALGFVWKLRHGRPKKGPG